MAEIKDSVLKSGRELRLEQGKGAERAACVGSVSQVGEALGTDLGS